MPLDRHTMFQFLKLIVAAFPETKLLPKGYDYYGSYMHQIQEGKNEPFEPIKYDQHTYSLRACAEADLDRIFNKDPNATYRDFDVSYLHRSSCDEDDFIESGRTHLAIPADDVLEKYNDIQYQTKLHMLKDTPGITISKPIEFEAKYDRIERYRLVKIDLSDLGQDELEKLATRLWEIGQDNITREKSGLDKLQATLTEAKNHLTTQQKQWTTDPNIQDRSGRKRAGGES